MANLGTAIAGDIANALLKHYARGPALAQTIADKPLLSFLAAGKKTFPGGNQYVSDPVQGAFMSDGTAVLGGGAFFQGYSEDQQLQFAQAANILRAEYKWYEVHAGLVITWTELKKDGITITDDNKKSEHSGIAIDRLTALFQNRQDDFGESWSRSINNMLWGDGSQDAAQVPGITAIFPDANTTGTIGGLSRVTYPWWRHRVNLGIQASATNQTLVKTIRTEQRQLRKFQGKPNKFLCGSAFLDALELEFTEKGFNSMSGFAKDNNDIDVGTITLRGVGTFQYDPTLDDLGRSKYCYEFDSRRIVWRPMDGEENKVTNPARPYQYMVFLNSMTTTGALQCTQLNANEVFSIA